MQIINKKLSLNPFNFVAIFSILVIFFSCSNEPFIQNPNLSQQSKVLFQETINGVTCSEGIQQSGALYRVCVPSNWNRELVLYAHGYVASNLPIALPDLTLEDTTSIEKIITDMGYAFATTSYSKNGLAVKEGIDDLVDLVDIFKNDFGRASHIYLLGESEGGLITTLSMEKKFIYSGGLSLCAPTGDFAKQINYFGDFRVVFDYYFPGVIPGSPVEIPQEVMDNFETVYAPAILKALKKKPFATAQVLLTTRARVDISNFVNLKNSIGNTFLSLLWANIFTTNNANEVLGGQAFDNSDRIYKGGFFMKYFNKKVTRYTADEKALNEIEENYQTSGNIFKPLVTMHTLKDQIVPEWQQDLYVKKVNEKGGSEFLSTQTIYRYGHCNFTSTELIDAFNLLVFKVTGRSPLVNIDLRELHEVIEPL